MCIGIWTFTHPVIFHDKPGQNVIHGLQREKAAVEPPKVNCSLVGQYVVLVDVLIALSTIISCLRRAQRLTCCSSAIAESVSLSRVTAVSRISSSLSAFS